MQEQEFLKSENKMFQQQIKPQSRTVVESLIHEYNLLIQGLNNQEYQDYCFVKGACGQTIPLVLILPLSYLIGTFQLFLKLFRNFQEEQLIPTIFQFLFLEAALCLTLYLVLKACEVIPKKIENPLLFGRITTYIFMCFSLAEGTLVLEKIIEFNQMNDINQCFWGVFSLVIWQKIIQLFVYDSKIRMGTVIFIYFYYLFRIENNNFLYNLFKVLIYVGLEFVIIIDQELKNYSQYQLENRMQYRNNKEQIQFMVPPVSMFSQQLILEQFTNQLPIVIFDQTKELLHISGVGLKQLQLDDGTGILDLISAEIKLRKMEIIKVLQQYQNQNENLQKLRKQAKFGSTCGTNDKGELLHSLINGPALQQLRNLRQPQEESRIINLNAEGILEKCLNDLIQTENSEIKGISKYNLPKEQIKYFKFTLLKVNKGDQLQIFLILDDITEVYEEILKNNTKVEDDVPIITKEFREYLFYEQKETLPLNLLNLEIKSLLKQQEQTLFIQEEILDFQDIQNEITNYSHCLQIQNCKVQIQNNILKNKVGFKSDRVRMLQIIKILIQNSINNTKDGFIQILLEDDQRQNCIQITIEDTGKGLDASILKNQTSPNIRSLQIANYLSKILGPMFYCKKIQGFVANQGLRIKTIQDCGVKIQFSIRNLAIDELQTHYIIDEEISQEEIDIDQEEIIERYIRDDDSIQYLQRMNRGIRYSIINKQQQNLKLTKPIESEGQKKQTKLAGMMKLQELGRLKRNLQSEKQNQICQCNNILIVNSDYKFKQLLEQNLDPKSFNALQFICEQDVFKFLNISLKDKKCDNIGCTIFKSIIFNCSQSYFYQELIQKIQSMNTNFKITMLIYTFGGEINNSVNYLCMPKQINQLLQYFKD